MVHYPLNFVFRKTFFQERVADKSAIDLILKLIASLQNLCQRNVRLKQIKTYICRITKTVNGRQAVSFAVPLGDVAQLGSRAPSGVALGLALPLFATKSRELGKSIILIHINPFIMLLFSLH